ncbi:MAG: hypothetical protein IJQ66_02770 [Clostridia bacterium]|nr:hypothetical protein [Clostridia bacterium]
MGRIDLNSLNGVKFNGVEVDGIKIDGVTVFAPEYPITYIPTNGTKEYKTWDYWSFLLKPNGNYPTSYKSSVGATIDTPYTSERDKPNNGGSFRFYGYFKDLTCTEPFNGIITLGTKGEVKVYAKIKMTATPFY